MQFFGALTALVTPFKNGAVDEAAYREFIEFQISEGIHGLVPCGTTGESATLSHEEHERVIEICIDQVKGRVPVLAGAGSNNTIEAIRLTRFAQKAGADGALLITPYYNKPTQQGQYEYFRAIAEASSKSIVIYNVPGRTGVNMTAETCLRLAEEVENIVAVKEASGNYAQISEIIRNRPEGFSVLSGNDNETLSLMATGADGVISVASNLVPAEMTALVRAMQEGRLDEARRLNFRLMPLFKGCFIESNPIPVKAGMAALGLLEDSLRLPLTSASAATRAAMEEILKDLDILKK